MTSERRGCIHRFGSFVLQSALWIVAALFALWAIGALWYDFPVAPHGAAAAFGVLLVVLLFLVRGSLTRPLSWMLLSLAVLIWWLTLQPRSDRNWQPDVAQTAWADIDGDVITLHNVRRCDYQSVSDYTPRWETRTVRLSKITGIDFAITYWGSPYMAHPIASFQFADAPPLCFSIETRKEVGEKYSAIGGFFRQYELAYVVADETDVIRLRTNVRKGEDVYLYRLTVTPEEARARFMDYITTLNQLHERPRWYNAATTNCTTSIRSQHDAAQRAPWDWRILVNGKADEMMFERGAFVPGGLTFPELRAAARINDAAKDVAADETYSRRIREGRPGFIPASSP
jgi:hypothetical protein